VVHENDGADDNWGPWCINDVHIRATMVYCFPGLTVKGEGNVERRFRKLGGSSERDARINVGPGNHRFLIGKRPGTSMCHIGHIIVV
jgi:hypothetical protein